MVKNCSQMNVKNRAMCFALRNPPPGVKKAKLKDIQKLVRKSKGGKPSLAAISKAAATFKDSFKTNLIELLISWVLYFMNC